MATNPSPRESSAEEPASPLPATQGEPGFAIVGLGASAGGLDAFQRFFSSIGPDTGLAFVLVQHLDPTQESLAVELLSRHAKIPVTQAQDGMRVAANHAYVIPPNKYLAIGGGRLQLTDPLERRGMRMPIDFFFRSLAADQQERAIAIVLSGTGTDGTLGVREIKAVGGMVMVQTPESCQFDGMATSAIATDVVDLVLPVEQMAEALLNYVQLWRANAASAPLAHGAAAEGPLDSILSLLRTRVGFGFESYKKGTLVRRVQRRMSLRRLRSLQDYLDVLRDDRAELDALYKDLLIRVTNFFRDPESWQALEQLVVEPLVRDHCGDRPLRVWVPGCATGEEAYSLAMLFFEQLQLARKPCQLLIFASDIDAGALAFARAGNYPENIVSDVSAERLRRFFVKADHNYRVQNELRESVIFAEQNVITDPPFSKMDLISCRNLLIYLEQEAQGRILSMFHFALVEQGYLSLGGSETIGPKDDLFTPLARQQRIYRRIGDVRHERLEFPSSRAVNRRQKIHESPLEFGDLRARRLTTLAKQLVLTRFAPACAVINRKADVLYLHGPLDDFLQVAVGEPSSNLLAMAREGLRARLRPAIQQALNEDRTIRLSNIRIQRDQVDRSVDVLLEPLSLPRQTEGLLLVTFVRNEESPGEPTEAARTGDAADEREEEDPAVTARLESIVKQLDDELRSARSELQSTIEDLEASEEEFKAANEEVTSINEELQSTNEELETSKEELQSLNEELQTVNNQLEQKVSDLESANNDLHNLLASSEIATVFLDKEMRLRRFTPATARLLRVRDTDIGRPISDLAKNFTDEEFLKDAAWTLERHSLREAEVEDTEGRWFLRRIVPYRTDDHHVEGVVVTFTDITARKRREAEVRALNEDLQRRIAAQIDQLRKLIDNASDSMLVVSRHGKIVQSNAPAEESFGYARQALLGLPMEEILAPRHRAQMRQRLSELLHASVSRPISVKFEAAGLRKDGGEFPVDIRLHLMGEDGDLIVLAEIRDQSERERVAALQNRLAAIVESSPAAIAILALDGTIRHWNRGAERLLGYTAQEALGRDVRSMLPPERNDEFDRILEMLNRGETVEDYEVAVVDKSGARVELAVSMAFERDRTGQITGVCGIGRDIRERKLLEQRIALRSDEERQRFSHELHDSLGQQVTAIGLLTASLQDKWGSDSPAADQIARLAGAAEEAKRQLRTLAKGLFPVAIEAHGLRVALDELSCDVTAAHPITCCFDSPVHVKLDDSFTASQLYLIAREAVHNAVKHSSATRIDILLDQEDGLRLVVRDNGVGLPPGAWRAAGVGLRIMRHRCSLIGGNLRVDSGPSGGTEVVCSLPPGR